MLASSHTKTREGKLQRLRSLILCALAAAFLVTQVTSKSEAGKKGPDQESWRRLGETPISRSNAPTKVTVIGHSVLVPVTLEDHGNQVDVQLLLDTGSSGTIINTEVADRLSLNLSSARKTQGRVVGGAFIRAYQITIGRISFGPYTRDNPVVFVVPHKGPPQKHDGLLGMDMLRGLKYDVDLEKQLIMWE